MKYYNHIIDRNIIEWGSFGKYGNEPMRKTLIRDLSDSHLMRIVEMVESNVGFYTEDIIKLMKDEVSFRTKNHIFVPETY